MQEIIIKVPLDQLQEVIEWLDEIMGKCQGCGDYIASVIEDATLISHCEDCSE